MKNFRNLLSCFCLLAAWAMGMTSCDKYNYTKDLQKLGKRVEVLEQMVLEANTELTALNELVIAIEKNGYVTHVVHNTDGTYTITFNTGRTVTLHHGRDGKDGRDGKSADLNIGVAQDKSDGKWYWTLDGKWLLDGDGNKMPVGATDGKDGKDGIDGKDGKDGQDGEDGQDGKATAVVIPLVRINPITRYWEISTDSGITWTNTGVCADGKDGTDGKDGKEDLFVDIHESEDGQFLVFVLRDGRVYTVPLTKD